MTPVTTNAARNADKAIFDANFDAIADRVYMLKDRWSDERQYEDFADYRANLIKFLAAIGIVVKSITKTFRITLVSGVVLTFLASGRVRIAF